MTEVFVAHKSPLSGDRYLVGIFTTIEAAEDALVFKDWRNADYDIHGGIKHWEGHSEDGWNHVVKVEVDKKLHDTI